ncbi:MAG: DEAD/DEAH box helicase family protein [Candidatus Odinarchaeum yellowstonii]|uniref:DEAD/DEAH box helicase family protein n=1 Tax=Odinarchaeota yellowstonii (strain LCB_4) TaxID=1841599 RepID=A0AAF0D1Y8_ODILC|nr:MAG: DEAD/DEAH box helicase family protein [Candidatus Odinarchaeum yellowstonii]
MSEELDFRSLNIKKSYNSITDDLLNDFYIPVLSRAVKYSRLVGFFSSSSLAVAARGITGLIKNGGYINLACSPNLSEEDIKIIRDSSESPEKYIERKLLQELDNLENEFVKNHVYALGWMLANKKLNLKIVFPVAEDNMPLSSEKTIKLGIFHVKIGILEDSLGNKVSFSGSVNETAAGWKFNIEKIKVFRSWVESEKDYLETDIRDFNYYWTGSVNNKLRIIDAPEAVKEKLVLMSPKEIDKITIVYPPKQNKIILHPHQNEAVNKWIENNFRGIFEMATGTGKTFAALECIKRALETNNKLLIIVSTPYHHLNDQWKKQVDNFQLNFDSEIIADSTNKDWKNNLADQLVELSIGKIKSILVLTTHRTLSSEDFRKIIQYNSINKNYKIFMIGDEVHWLGAEKYSNALLESYDLRLGLSATPVRIYDTFGTRKIIEYFNGIVKSFSLEDALTKINPETGDFYLCDYEYHPRIAYLNEEEIFAYINETKKIIKTHNLRKYQDSDLNDEILELLAYRRSNIIKNCRMKYQILDEILKELGEDLHHTIIYCTPQQIKTVMKIVNLQHRIKAHKFTMEEGTAKSPRFQNLSEREFILKKFASGEYQVLIAMKCLDEGVDIPAAETAILMASSGNPREYIQRMGRLLRRYPNKKRAKIYDIIAIPDREKLPFEYADIEQKILEKELNRYMFFAKNALNGSEAQKILLEIKYNCI